jgi:hypothetical protein
MICPKCNHSEDFCSCAPVAKPVRGLLTGELHDERPDQRPRAERAYWWRVE